MWDSYETQCRIKSIIVTAGPNNKVADGPQFAPEL